MRSCLAGVAYFAIVFTVGFILGTIRVVIIAPRTGALVAVALELPLILCASWLATKFLVRRFQAPPHASDRLTMGAIAFVLTLAAEMVFGALVFGQPIGATIGKMALPVGMLGLAGQIAFATMPYLEGRFARQ